MENQKTIVAFHLGRGGRFNNGGHKSFVGQYTITDILSIADDRGKWNFIKRQKQDKVMELLDTRHLPNLQKLFDKSMSNDDFSEFTRRTKIDMGELMYVDSNGNELITVEEADTGVGCINYDNEYDTYICQYIDDCDINELLLIAEDGRWDLLAEAGYPHAKIANDVGELREYLEGFWSIEKDMEEITNEEYQQSDKDVYTFAGKFYREL
jgi:hypothetical protein